MSRLNFDRLGRLDDVRNFRWEFAEREFPHGAAANMLEERVTRSRAITDDDSHRRGRQRASESEKKQSAMMALDALRHDEILGGGTASNSQDILANYEKNMSEVQKREYRRNKPKMGQRCRFLPSRKHAKRTVPKARVIGMCFTIDGIFRAHRFEKTYFVVVSDSDRSREVIEAVRESNIWAE